MSAAATADCPDCQPAQSTSAQAATPVAAHAHAATLVDAATFEPPALGSSDGLAPRVVIEFCDRCRYAPRAQDLPETGSQSS